jgi:hypothetical protein
MSGRKQKMAAQIGEFMRQYQRKAQGGKNEPNDRQYNRKLERKLKRLKPEELDDLLQLGFWSHGCAAIGDLSVSEGVL